MYGKKTLTTAVLVLAIGSSTLFTVLPAYAADGSTPTKMGPIEDIAQFFEKKFNLNHEQVQSALSEYKTQHKADRDKNIGGMEKKRLDMLVSQGKITSAQETAILKELAELKAKYQINDPDNQTPDQRKTAMTNFQNDLKAWSDAQKIDLQYIEPFGGKMMKMGHGYGMWKKSSTITPHPTQ